MKTRCEACEGTGRVSTMEPKRLGRCRSGEMVYSRFTVPIHRQCGACGGCGKVEDTRRGPAPEAGAGAVKIDIAREVDGTLQVGGFRITAPTFRDDAQFDRAIQRAFDAGLQVHPTSHARRFRVLNPASGSTYTTDRTACSCCAGQTGTPCKHVAIVCFLLDVRQQIPAPMATRQAVAA